MRSIAGTMSFHVELGRRMAAFKGAEAAERSNQVLLPTWPASQRWWAKEIIQNEKKAALIVIVGVFSMDGDVAPRRQVLSAMEISQRKGQRYASIKAAVSRPFVPALRREP